MPSTVSCGAVALVPKMASMKVTAASRADVILVPGLSIEPEKSIEITTSSALMARVTCEVASTVTVSNPSTRMKVVGTSPAPSASGFPCPTRRR